MSQAPALKKNVIPTSKVVLDITAMIITFNEAPNIARTLDAVAWVKEIVIVDSGSTDETLAIVARYANARVVTRKFDSFAEQCNFGLSQVRTDWVLSLDADYELTNEVASNMRELVPGLNISGFRLGFVYRIFGRPLQGTLYPPRVVLYRRDRAHYQNEGHGHRVAIDGTVQDLPGVIYHDDRKPLGRWFASQANYARLEAEHLLAADRKSLGMADRIRLMGWPAPFVAGFYVLFVKGCIRNGWAGWYYVLQRVLAEMLLAIELTDRRLRDRARG